MRLDEASEVSRPVQVVAGVVLGLLCGLFLLGGIVGIWSTLDGLALPPGAVVFFALCVVLGLGGVCIAGRLVLGRRRSRDGGLFSPTALRASSVCWFIGTLLLAYASPFHLLDIVFFVGVGTAMLALAARREREMPS